MHSFDIRDATGGDLPLLAELFTRSVHEIACNSYTPEQLRAWAPPAPDLSLWAERFAALVTYVAEHDGRMAGFISIKPPAHVEMLFSHPDFSRLGVANALFRHAVARLPDPDVCMTTEASLEARPFFAGQGFVVVEEEAVERNGQMLSRFRMRRPGGA